jgi:hypothetical protein
VTLTVRRAVYVFLAAALMGLFFAVPQLADAQTFANCTEAEQAGRTDIPESDPAYDEALDRDGDGIACESGDGGNGSTGGSDAPDDEPGDGIPTPNRIDTGGGYCALNDCD